MVVTAPFQDLAAGFLMNDTKTGPLGMAGCHGGKHLAFKLSHCTWVANHKTQSFLASHPLPAGAF